MATGNRKVESQAAAPAPAPEQPQEPAVVNGTDKKKLRMTNLSDDTFATLKELGKGHFKEALQYVPVAGLVRWAINELKDRVAKEQAAQQK